MAPIINTWQHLSQSWMISKKAKQGLTLLTYRCKTPGMPRSVREIGKLNKMLGEAIINQFCISTKKIHG